VYIANKLRALDTLEGISNEKMEEPKEAFEKYFKEKPAIRNITAKNYFEKIVVKDGGTVNFN